MRSIKKAHHTLIDGTWLQLLTFGEKVRFLFRSKELCPRVDFLYVASATSIRRCNWC